MNNSTRMSEAFAQYQAASEALANECAELDAARPETVDAASDAYAQVCASEIVTAGDVSAMLRAVLCEVPEGGHLTAQDRSALSAVERHASRMMTE